VRLNDPPANLDAGEVIRPGFAPLDYDILPDMGIYDPLEKYLTRQPGTIAELFRRNRKDFRHWNTMFGLGAVRTSGLAIEALAKKSWISTASAGYAREDLVAQTDNSVRVGIAIFSSRKERMLSRGANSRGQSVPYFTQRSL
jgi:hypothetical protein